MNDNDTEPKVTCARCGCPTYSYTCFICGAWRTICLTNPAHNIPCKCDLSLATNDELGRRDIKSRYPPG
jgi:hypothetical protein